MAYLVENNIAHSEVFAAAVIVLGTGVVVWHAIGFVLRRLVNLLSENDC